MIARTLAAAAIAALLPLPAAAQETRASAARKFSQEFAASDTNKDGVLTRAEVEARIRRMGTGAKKLDPVHVKRLADLWFTRADADKNGKVTEKEAQALLTATFARYDADGNGQLGAGERAAAKQSVTGRKDAGR